MIWCYGRASYFIILRSHNKPDHKTFQLGKNTRSQNWCFFYVQLLKFTGMAVKVYKQNSWTVIEETGKDKQFFNPNESRLIINGTDYTLVDSNRGYKKYLGPFANIQNEAGDSFASDADLQEYLSTFVNFKLGDGTIPDRWKFADAATRDAYFDANPNELKESIEVKTGDVIQKYTAADGWANINPNAYWTYNPVTDKIEISKDIQGQSAEFLPGSVQLGNIKESGANHTLGLENLGSGQKGVAVIQRYDDTGSERAEVYELGAVATVDRQLLFNEGQPSVPYGYGFTFGPSENIWWTGLVVIPEEEGTFIFTMLTNDANGVPITVQDKFVFTAPMVGNEVTVTLTNSFALFQNETVWIVLSGAKIFGGTPVATWLPYFKSIEQEIISFPKILTEKDEIKGGGYFESQVTTFCEFSTSHYKIDAVFTPWTTQENWSYDATNKRFIYTGPSGKSMGFLFNFSAASGTNNSRLEYMPCVNGVPITGVSAVIDSINNNKEQRMGINAQVTLNTNDYLEFCVTADGNGINAYTSHCQLSIR